MSCSVPSAVGRFVAEAIPDCRSTFVPEAGHYLVVDLMDEIPGTLFAA